MAVFPVGIDKMQEKSVGFVGMYFATGIIGVYIFFANLSIFIIRISQQITGRIISKFTKSVFIMTDGIGKKSKVFL